MTTGNSDGSVPFISPKTRKEIEAQIAAARGPAYGTYTGSNYEAGVAEALDWILGNYSGSPMEAFIDAEGNVTEEEVWDDRDEPPAWTYLFPGHVVALPELDLPEFDQPELGPTEPARTEPGPSRPGHAPVRPAHLEPGASQLNLLANR